MDDSVFEDAGPRSGREITYSPSTARCSGEDNVGRQEFVILDFVSWREKYPVLVIESKRVGLEGARKQCFLAMKDTREKNGGGTVYGFLTTGVDWRIPTYDGSFQISERIVLIFDTIRKDKRNG